MGVIGWFILILESMVAAPMWAAAHAFPEGEGMAGQHGKQGYMLFLNVLMRPSLMVFGFFASFAGMKVVGWLIGATFLTYVSSATASSAVGPITIVAMVSIMTMLVIQAAHRIFGLINYLPENVMRWVGGMGSQLGEAQDQQSVKMALAAATGSVASAMGQGTQSIGNESKNIQANAESKKAEQLSIDESQAYDMNSQMDSAQSNAKSSELAAGKARESQGHFNKMDEGGDGMAGSSESQNQNNGRSDTDPGNTRDNGGNL